MVDETRIRRMDKRITDAEAAETASTATAAAHISNTSNPHSVTKAQVGLTNVTNTAQIPLAYLDTDGTLAANSDTKVASQKAAKTYSDTKIASSYLDTDGTLAANLDTKIATQKATKTYSDTKMPSSYLDTDGALAANSDVKVASQKATKTYADTKVAKSTYDAHTILYATTDNTPEALTVGEQTLVGRETGGNIAAISIDSVIGQGWVPSVGAWTYVSATSFTVSGNKTTKYGKGDKLKWTQNGTVRYSNIIATPTYSAGTGLTTITIHAGYISSASDCAILDTATYPITANYYSKIQNPQGWPGMFYWTPTLTGFSVDPPNAIYRFRIIGRTVEVIVSQGGGDGTSNANTFKISLPVASANISTYNDAWGMCGYTVDNGSALTSPAGWRVKNNASEMDLYKDAAVGAWATGNGKRTRLVAKYEY